MKVLIFSLAYQPIMGGAEVAIREISERMPEVEFDMITLKFSQSHPYYQKVGNVGVYRIGGGIGYVGKVLFIPHAVYEAFKLHYKHKYDMLWGMMTYMVFPIAIMRLFGNRTPYIITLQDGDPFEEVFERDRIKVFKPLLKYGFMHARVVQVISTFLSKWPGELGYKGPIEIVPNGVDISKFNAEFSKEDVEKVEKELGKKKGDVILFSASRLVKKNGLEDIIRSLKYLPENFKFVNWGSGPLKDRLVSVSKELGLFTRVFLYDYVDTKKLPLYFRAGDIFVRPSLSEGQGIAFLEAFASKRPVVATEVGGITDFLFDPDINPDKESTGLYAKVHNPESIARQVERLVKDKKLTTKIIKNAYSLVEAKYDWDLIVKEMRSKVFETI